MRSNDNIDYGSDARDDQFDELMSRRTNSHVRRPAKRRKSPKNRNASAPGGIRQRKNKRWAW